MERLDPIFVSQEQGPVLKNFVTPNSENQYIFLNQNS